jgi:hypothetical protein
MLEDLIPAINKLQDVVSRLDCPLELDLPQIVMVGGQVRLYLIQLRMFSTKFLSFRRLNYLKYFFG